MKLAFINLGCPKNQVDLELILGALDGVRITEKVEEADAVIVNSCAFIESAKRESIDAIFAAVAARADNPALKIVVSGCLPQRYRQELAELLPEADRFCFSTDPKSTAAEIRSFLNLPPPTAPTRRLLSPKHYAYLRIADGCDNRCAYCAIPLIKGGYVSRPPDDILREAHQLTAAGVKELLIIAQDTTDYGKEFGSSLPALLQQLNRIDGVNWIRLMYTHPAHWNERLIEQMAGLEKILPYADIPIQHIADKVLRRMGRKVTRAQIERLLERLRREVPHIALRTSIIVGFPGETDAEFNELLDFLQEVRFERLGVFTYSHEEGTRAFDWHDDVPEEVKLERQTEIMRLQAEAAEERNAALVGKTLLALIDECDPSGDFALGRTMWDAPEVDGNIILPKTVLTGEFYRVCVTGYDFYDLKGQIVDAEPADARVVQWLEN